MEYQVPQFIEVEDKIFGPLTLKQFIYLAGGAGIAIGAILYLPFFFGILVAAPAAGFAAALAFYKHNGKPFVELLEAGFNYYVGRRLYLWRKEKTTVVEQQVPRPAPPAPAEEQARKKLGLSTGKLHELAWSLDVKNTGQEQEDRL